jgi:hypothetical protein
MGIARRSQSSIGFCANFAETAFSTFQHNRRRAAILQPRVGMMHIVCYLRQGSNVFETYWTTIRGVEAMDNSYRLLV